MTSSISLKKLATQVRRTDTVLRHLAVQLHLNEADKATLLNAANVLSVGGKLIAMKAKRSKQEEDARDLAVVKATKEAKELMRAWPKESTIDKISLCIGNLMEASLRRDLDSATENLDWSLAYWVEQAMLEIPASAAWKSVRDGLPVAALMSHARERFERIRQQSSTALLADRWRIKAEGAVQKH
jgi:hypothetical protein